KPVDPNFHWLEVGAEDEMGSRDGRSPSWLRVTGYGCSVRAASGTVASVVELSTAAAACRRCHPCLARSDQTLEEPLEERVEPDRGQRGQVQRLSRQCVTRVRQARSLASGISSLVPNACPASFLARAGRLRRPGLAHR